MPITLHEATFNEAYPRLVDMVMSNGREVKPRGKITREIRPVMLQVSYPKEHLVTSYGRPVNVAFALAEVLWILAGRSNVEMLEFYNSNIKQFSDDGLVFNAAYGHRLRYGHGFDQLKDVIKTLKVDPESRQAVLNIWHPLRDRGWEGWGHKPRETKDRACNTQAYLLVRDGKLEWTQLQRSNDIIWGTPYNWMQWSHVQRYVADELGVQVGSFTHVINSLHIYMEGYYNGEEEADRINYFSLYSSLGRGHTEGDISKDALREALTVETRIRDPRVPLDLERVGGYLGGVLGVLAAHRAYRAGEDSTALMLLQNADPIYGPAQARFYLAHRWGKPEYKHIRTDISKIWPFLIGWLMPSDG